MFQTVVKKYISEGSKINQIIMASLIVLPVLSYGMAIGWLSPMGALLMSPATPAAAPISSETVSWMASVPYLVGTPAVFLFGYLADHHGRKKALMLASFSMTVCWGVKLLSTEPWVLIVGRATVGFGVAGSYVVTPLYMKEISEDCIRGTLGSLVILSQSLGNLLVYVMGEYLSYRAVLWVCLCVPVLHLLAFCMMPDTPSYLLKCGKLEEAQSVLAWLRCRPCGAPSVERELRALQHEQATRLALGDALRAIMSEKAASRAFRITVIITLARELCGCISVLHFASQIFEQASGGSMPLSGNQQAAVLGAVQLFGSLTASTLVERTGRKPLLGGTCLVSGMALAVLGGCFWLGGGAPALSWLPIVALCLCIYCDASGLQPVPFVIMTELFPFQLRGTVTTLVIALACILVSIELRVFQPLAAAFGLSTMFLLFAAVCLVSTVYIAVYVPETKQRTLEDIYEELGGKKVDDCETANTRL